MLNIDGHDRVRVKRYAYEKIHLYLIKPSKYDDDGYVIRHWKGVLPSNTLACLYALSEDVRDRKSLGESLAWQIDAVDETIQEVQVKKIIRQSRSKRTKTVVCLVGVQSNQFPRARDLALTFKSAGIDVLLGGFHVSGVMATIPELTSELRELKEAGVTLVGGEVEGRWEDLLRGALTDTLHPVYNFIASPPDLSDAPIPRIPKHLVNRYAVRHFATLDCGRGCPYNCSFCTVINVQGRHMRFRPVQAILARVRENFTQHRIHFYFFTDDNFCRNNNWPDIFDGLIDLKEKERIPISFMMQVDTQSYKIPRFIEKAARAGCSQVFIGMESLNEANLKSAGKNQNKAVHFKELIDAYHNAGIVTHLAYIVGFPFDTERSVDADMIRLRALEAEQASFFMLTPLPGSMDYKKMLAERTVLDADLNNFDSFHETFQHAHLHRGAWNRVYQRAWEHYYSIPSMIHILRKTRPDKYWGVLLNFIWYKNAFQVEGGHPMIHGFFRLKGRRNRRPTFALESRWLYMKRRLYDLYRTFSGWVKLALEMEEVWLATRRRSVLETQVLREMEKVRMQADEWRGLRLSELEELYRKARTTLERSRNLCAPGRIKIPSAWFLWFSKWNVFADSLTFTRQPMARFWHETLGRLKCGRIDSIRYSGVIFTSFRECVFFIRFAWSVLSRVVYPQNHLAIK